MVSINSPSPESECRFCSSKYTPTPRSLSSRTVSSSVTVFLAKRLIDFVRTRSMRPALQSAINRWYSGLEFLTKRHHILPVVCAAVGQLDLMVGKRCGSEPSVTFTHNTQRVGRQERCTDLFPRSAVAFIAVGIAVVSVISFGFLFLMFLTVPTRGQLGAAGVGAGFLCFIWHVAPPVLRIRKAPWDCSREARVCI